MLDAVRVYTPESQIPEVGKISRNSEFLDAILKLEKHLHDNKPIGPLLAQIILYSETKEKLDKYFSGKDVTSYISERTIYLRGILKQIFEDKRKRELTYEEMKQIIDICMAEVGSILTPVVAEIPKQKPAFERDAEKILKHKNKLPRLKLSLKKIAAGIVLVSIMGAAGTLAVAESKMPGIIKSIPSIVQAAFSNGETSNMMNAMMNGAHPVEIQLSEDMFTATPPSSDVVDGPPITLVDEDGVSESPTPDEPAVTETPSPEPPPTEEASNTPDPTETPESTETETQTATPTEEPTETATFTKTPTEEATFTDVPPTAEPPTEVPVETVEITTEPPEEIATEAVLATEAPATSEATQEAFTADTPYEYLQGSIMNTLNAISGIEDPQLLAALKNNLGFSEMSDEEFTALIDSVKNKFETHDRIVVNLVITDNAGYGEQKDEALRYFDKGQEHLGNSDGVIQVVFHDENISLFFFGRDAPAHYVFNGRTGQITTLEKMGAPITGYPRNEDGTIKSASDNINDFMTVLTGQEGDLNIKLSLGSLNMLFSQLFPDGIDIILNEGLHSQYMNLEPGVLTHLPGPELVRLLGQRKGLGVDKNVNSTFRGSETTRRILAGDGNIARIIEAIKVRSFTTALFGQNLTDQDQAFQVHGGPEGLLIYKVFGLLNEQDPNFASNLVGMMARNIGNVNVVTMQPMSNGYYADQIEAVVNGND